ncbi:unnamed protein product [Peniophora sp. CBMAI 1063]|nr:unnamed protein product [Peniophora sp. CBMAI 1063]
MGYPRSHTLMHIRAADPSGTPPLTTHNDTRSIIGPIFIGHSVNWLLLGMLFFQLYLYEKGRTRTVNKFWLRCLVYSIFVIDVAQTAISSQALWHFAIDIWGDPVALVTVVPWSEPLIPALSGLVALLVQLFYAWRIWVLQRSLFSRVMAIIIILLSFMQFGASLHTPVIILKAHLSFAAFADIQTSVDIWLATSFTVDVLIAGSMIWLLYQARTRTLWIQSQSLYDRLIISSVQTGLLTAVTAGVDLALWKIYPQDNYFVAPPLILGKLYSNSLFSTLNGRAFFQDSPSLPRSDPHHLGSGRSPWAGRYQASSDTGAGLEVRVLREREQHQDDPSKGAKPLGRHSDPLGRVGHAVEWKSAVAVGDPHDDERVVELSDLSKNRADDDSVHKA